MRESTAGHVTIIAYRQAKNFFSRALFAQMFALAFTATEFSSPIYSFQPGRRRQTNASRSCYSPMTAGDWYAPSLVKNAGWRWTLAWVSSC